jgi:hypothetical protein
MKWNGTILWRFAVLGLFASLVPLGLHALDKHDKVDTDRSLAIRSGKSITAPDSWFPPEPVKSGLINTLSPTPQ